MDRYLDTLQAFYKFLDYFDHRLRRNQIAQAINEWQTNKSTQFHMSCYGKECFNDTIISALNGHSVNPEQEAWVNTLFGRLVEIGYTLAKAKGESIPVAEMEKHVPVTYSSKTSQQTLSSWRCFSCGYAQVTERNIDWFLASSLIQKNILRAYDEGRLADFVDRVLHEDRSYLIPMKEDLKRKIMATGIVLGELGHSDECPRCGHFDTAAFQWELDPQGSKFIASPQNLPLTWRYRGKRNNSQKNSFPK